MPTAYVLLNSDLGSDESIIDEVKKILVEEDVTYEIQGVYGVYDIVLRLSSNDAEKLRGIITNNCLLYTSPSPRDRTRSRMPSSA